MASFFETGLQPPRLVADPVQWRPRHYHTRAEYLCNQAFDIGDSYAYVDSEVRKYKAAGANGIAYSDGGCRGTGTSSFAWVVYAVIDSGQSWHRFTVAFGYEVVSGDYSSFATELWGLERAVVVMKDFVNI